MPSPKFLSSWQAVLFCGLVAGIAIAAVDNLAFGGEVSPIVIVALLFVSTTIFGFMWGRLGTLAAGITWVCVPLIHLVKHILGLPDTLHPNTIQSILMLAIFTLVVASIGTGCGLFGRRIRG